MSSNIKKIAARRYKSAHEFKQSVAGGEVAKPKTVPITFNNNSAKKLTVPQ